MRPPEPEWGLMLNTLRTAIYVQPWVAALPGAVIFITSISFNLLSDGLRSAMDVKQLNAPVPALVARDRGGPAQPLLTVRGLVKHFPVRKAVLGRVERVVRAVDGVDFEVLKGETLGVVGESGCGKSTTARLLMQLIAPDAGEILFDGEPVGSRRAAAAGSSAARCRWCSRTATRRSIRA